MCTTSATIHSFIQQQQCIVVIHTSHSPPPPQFFLPFLSTSPKILFFHPQSPSTPSSTSHLNIHHAPFTRTSMWSPQVPTLPNFDEHATISPTPARRRRHQIDFWPPPPTPQSNFVWFSATIPVLPPVAPSDRHPITGFILHMYKKANKAGAKKKKIRPLLYTPTTPSALP